MQTVVRLRRLRDGKGPILFLLALAFASAAGAQDTVTTDPLHPQADRIVCPLSDAQMQASIAAFAKMVPTFQNKRCANCHGGIDPFAVGTNHGGGQIDPSERPKMGEGGCNSCHSDLPPTGNRTDPVWELPFLPDMSFVKRDALSLCKVMRDSFSRGIDFELHILNDNGKTNFSEIAFSGTRGIPGIVPQPIQGLTLPQFFDQAKDWVAAMGGEFKGDDRCGCEPVHFGLRVSYKATINFRGTSQATFMGPVVVPIKFDDKGRYEGTGTLPISGAGQVRSPRGGCNSETEGALQISVSGQAVEQVVDKKMHNEMQINLTNTTGTTGTTGVQCPEYSGVYPLIGGDTEEFDFKVRGRVNDADGTRVPLPGPVNAILSVQLVEISSDAASQ